MQRRRGCRESSRPPYLTRDRRSLKFPIEVRWLRDTAHAIVNIWISDNPHRRRRAAAANDYSADEM